MVYRQIVDKPALYIPEYNILVIADLHIGIENELREYGVHVEDQLSLMESMLQDICEEYSPKDIILLGDIKHSIPSTPFYEKKNLYSFLSRLQRKACVHIIPGNHDGGIQSMVPSDCRIHQSEGFTVDRYGFVHGHRWPGNHLMKCDVLFCGHTHPTVKITDRLGFDSYEPCWVKAPVYSKSLQERYTSFNDDLIVIIIPAFNPLCGGSAVNDEGVVGPLRHVLDEKDAEIYLLDGSSIGTVKQWRKK